MRKVGHPDGAEFSLEDHAAWESLTVLRGQIVEVDLNSAGEEFPADLWGRLPGNKNRAGFRRRHGFCTSRAWVATTQKSPGGCRRASTDVQAASISVTATLARWTATSRSTFPDSGFSPQRVLPGTI